MIFSEQSKVVEKSKLEKLLRNLSKTPKSLFEIYVLTIKTVPKTDFFPNVPNFDVFDHFSEDLKFQSKCTVKSKNNRSINGILL